MIKLETQAAYAAKVKPTNVDAVEKTNEFDQALIGKE
jgi:hypothetical protein